MATCAACPSLTFGDKTCRWRWERDEGRDLAGVAQQDSIQPDVRCLAWSPSSHFLASGCEVMQVMVWISHLRKWSFNCQSGQTGIPMSHSLPTALGPPLLAAEAVWISCCSSLGTGMRNSLVLRLATLPMPGLFALRLFVGLAGCAQFSSVHGTLRITGVPVACA